MGSLIGLPLCHAPLSLLCIIWGTYATLFSFRGGSSCEADDPGQEDMAPLDDDELFAEDDPVSDTELAPTAADEAPRPRGSS